MDCTAPENRIKKPNGTYARDGLSIDSCADSFVAPRFEAVEAGSEAVAKTLSSVISPTLTQVEDAWLKGKRIEAGVAEGMESTPQIRTTMALWKIFTQRIGDLRINVLRPEHFRSFQEWSDRESVKKPSPQGSPAASGCSYVIVQLWAERRGYWATQVGRSSPQFGNTALSPAAHEGGASGNA